MPEADEPAPKPRWYSIKEAADHLDVGEPTLYRWMRDGRITYRKVGDSTRFLKEDLDAMMEVYHSAKEVGKVKEVCPLCHNGELLEGHVQSTGRNYFRLKDAKFWTLKEGNIATHARMCSHCGAILWFGDLAKVSSLRKESSGARASSESQ